MPPCRTVSNFWFIFFPLSRIYGIMGERSDLTIDPLASLAISESAAPATLALHADDVLNNVTDVAPPIHLSTTYRYAENPDELLTVSQRNVCTSFLLL